MSAGWSVPHSSAALVLHSHILASSASLDTTYAVTHKTRIFPLRIERFFVRRTKKRSIREVINPWRSNVRAHYVSGDTSLRFTFYAECDCSDYSVAITGLASNTSAKRRLRWRL